MIQEKLIINPDELVEPGPSSGILIGLKIPKDYFITKGAGESNITIHAGSYHLALKKAGIERHNIMTYSSILPSIANEIKKPRNLIHGSVMETIMAVENSNKGERATAGIIIGKLYEKNTNKKYGGIVCEYHGSLNERDVEEELEKSLEELCQNGYSHFDLRDKKIITESFIPKKRYGTAIVALCFTNYFYPVINKEYNLDQ